MWPALNWEELTEMALTKLRTRGLDSHLLLFASGERGAGEHFHFRPHTSYVLCNGMGVFLAAATANECFSHGPEPTELDYWLACCSL